LKQGVALTGRSTTGPPLRAAVACCPLVSYVACASVTDADRRRQTPATVTSLASYTMCRRDSNKRAESAPWFIDHNDNDNGNAIFILMVR